MCKTIPYFLKLLSQFGDCTSRMLSLSLFISCHKLSIVVHYFLPSIL
ncbi:unnamed protein product [Acanthoscelides obtectus]|uniref:Uncharacterized protein n=1 Tax=Acanthoscelides obtectus TaxID=200917 RepID=A0A9P0KLW7_ACAOB|nr:unnamed protein product [Acanthoscelides obtectus]CAK1687942.1 hypothetical protein AOBTE_LOCUS36465 [Acanthoscelides obtectus]